MGKEEEALYRSDTYNGNWEEKELIDPANYTLDLNRSDLTIKELYRIAQIVNTYGRVNIRNCAGVDVLRLGLKLMIEFEKMRKSQEGK